MADLWTICALVFIAIILLVYLFYKKRFRFWKESGFVHTQPQFPLGDAQGIGSKRSIGMVVNDIFKQFPNEKYVGFWMMFEPHLLIRDPELMKAILVKDFANFADRGIYTNEKDDPISGHLFSIGASKWRNLRVKLTPTFSSAKMKMMFPVVLECAQQLKRAMEPCAENEETVEVKEISARFATDIIAICAFGINSNCMIQPNSEFRYYGRMVFESSLSNGIHGFLIRFLPELCRFFSLNVFKKAISKFFISTFKENVEYRMKHNIKRNDFMDLLIQLIVKGKLEDVDGEKNDMRASKFTIEEAAAQAFIFYIAGFEPTSTTMQFALYELARNPDFQRKTRDEIRIVLEKHNGSLTYEGILEMKYLERVIYEVVRLYPPLSFLLRVCEEDYSIPNTNLVIPKGVKVVIDINGYHRDPNYFPDPDKFNPERYKSDTEFSKGHDNVYLGFGKGPRSCIGDRFGVMQTKIGMITLLTNFEFSVVPETPIPIMINPKTFMTTSIGGINLKIKKLKR